VRQCTNCKATYAPGVLICPRDGQETMSISIPEKDLFIGKFVGSFQIISKIGEGGMGVVYRVQHPIIKKVAAAKFLLGDGTAHRNQLNRFLAEAQAVSQLKHEHIVGILDFGSLEGRPYYIMEFIEGNSLSNLINAEKILPPSRAIDITLQLLDALHCAHNKGIVHRDIKPDNILLEEKGGLDSVKLLDFGIAKFLDHNTDSDSEKTKEGSVMGTPHYMSPEQANGTPHLIDPRSDLYSVGIVLYEMISGQLPFTGNTVGALVIAHITQQPPSLCAIRPSISIELEQIVLKSLQKRQEDRFQTALEMKNALQSILTWMDRTVPAIVLPSHQGQVSTKQEKGILSTLNEVNSVRATEASISKVSVSEKSPTKSRSVFITIGLLFIVIIAMFFLSYQPEKEKTLQVESNENRSQEIFNKAAQHFMRREFQEAIPLIKEAYDLYPNSSFLYDLARCYIELKQYKEAVYYLDRFIASNPSGDFLKNAEEYLKQATEVLVATTEPSKTNKVLVDPPVSLQEELSIQFNTKPEKAELRIRINGVEQPTVQSPSTITAPKDAKIEIRAAKGLYFLQKKMTATKSEIIMLKLVKSKVVEQETLPF
jgi:serine/threonine protein kinase